MLTCLIVFGLWSKHPTGDGFLGGEIVVLLHFIPSNIRISRTLGGSSSTLHSTSVRHSGHRSSLCVATISSKHFLQNVCWQASTLFDVSKRSRHTEHSSKSFSCFSSIVDQLKSKNKLRRKTNSISELTSWQTTITLWENTNRYLRTRRKRKCNTIERKFNQLLI